MSITYFCEKKCCKIKIKPYTNTKSYKYQRRRNHRKAGVFIYDPKEDRVLLVQSRGHLFGPPKGTLNPDEQDRKCAIREVKEETGLDVSYEDFSGGTTIRNRAIYYYLEMDSKDVNIQDSIEDNDANGITWIKMDCLERCILNGNIVLNHHAKIVFYRFKKKIFPRSNWIMVNRKKRNRKKY